jgi:hypothetical protein
MLLQSRKQRPEKNVVRPKKKETNRSTNITTDEKRTKVVAAECIDIPDHGDGE